jgi:hypothetical protein
MTSRRCWHFVYSSFGTADADCNGPAKRSLTRMLRLAFHIVALGIGPTYRKAKSCEARAVARTGEAQSRRGYRLQDTGLNRAKPSTEWL